MPNNKLIAAAVLALGFGACAKKQAEPEQPGGVPSQYVDAATQVGVSTDSKAGTMLNAPGNYMRGMAGNVGKAQKAAELAAKTAAERMNTEPQ